MTAVLRRLAGLFVAAHGVMHVVGVELLWRLDEPGLLDYRDVRPAPGSVGGFLVGALWLAALALFVVAGVLVAGRGRWQPMVLVAAALSAILISFNSQVGLVGLLVDLLLVTWTGVAWSRSRRSILRGPDASPGSSDAPARPVRGPG